MMNSLLLGLFRSTPLKPIRNFMRPLAARWPWPIGIRLPSGPKLYVDLRSSIGRGILVRGNFDKELSEFITRTLKPGDVFIDVGANIGYFSLLALDRIGPSGQAHAFEVDPRSLRCLRLTQSKNSLRNLIIYGIALGDMAGMVSLKTTEELGHTYIYEASNGTAWCPMLPLDSWAEYFTSSGVTLIKIDVEGAELSVLQGAKRVLQQCRPVVVCESIQQHFSRFGYAESDLFNFMEMIGYKSKTSVGSNECNLIFSPEGK